MSTEPNPRVAVQFFTRPSTPLKMWTVCHVVESICAVGLWDESYKLSSPKYFLGADHLICEGLWFLFVKKLFSTASLNTQFFQNLSKAVTNSGVVLDPQGCRTLLCERNWEIGVRGPLYVVLLVVFFYLV